MFHAELGYDRLRPYQPKIRGGNGIIIESIHFEEHIVPVPEEAAAPERIVAVGIER